MKKQNFIELIILVLLIGVVSFMAVRKFLPAKDDINATYATLEYKEKFDDTNPRQVSDFFAANIFHNPRKALELFKSDQGVSVEKLINSRNMILPKGDKIISIEFVKAEHGFTEMPSGIQSSLYTYKVTSNDDFQPNLMLDIDVFKENNVYRVLRYVARSK